MPEVVRVDEFFLSERIGNALARLWTVNGLTFELAEVTDVRSATTGDACICTFTTERPGNPGMTVDGHIYSMGHITQWLDKKDTSAQHKRKAGKQTDHALVVSEGCRTVLSLAVQG